MDTNTGANADLTGVILPAGVTAVTLNAPQKSAADPADPQAATVFRAADADKTLNIIGTPTVYNWNLIDQNRNPVSFQGNITVRIPVPSGLRGSPHVFRFDQSTGVLSDMGATAENGSLVFLTGSLGYFVIAGTGDSIALDTAGYAMPAGGKYQIGLKTSGTKADFIKVSSTNTGIAAVTKLKNGNYQVTAVKSGTAYIMFDVYDSKNKLLSHASVRIDGKTGIRSHGDSTRQTGIF